MNVVPLTVVKPQTDDVIVRCLRSLLEKAEAGKLLSIVVVGEWNEADSMFIEPHVSVGASYYSLIGALDVAKDRLKRVREGDT